MIAVKLFGAPAILADGTPISGPATQRHRLASLALLVAAPHHRLTRDKLIAYLWPESDQHHARNLLNQSIYALRRTLGSFTALVAGLEHTCGLTGAGTAYCWGANGVGQLGNGSTTGSQAPVAVSGSLSFSALAAGGVHTCGLTSAAAAYCWGDNFFGQLGNGSTTNSTTPTAVAGGLTFTVLALGWGHTCGLTSSGRAYCWGRNSSGQLGDAPPTNSLTPVATFGPSLPSPQVPITPAGSLAAGSPTVGAA